MVVELPKVRVNYTLLLDGQPTGFAIRHFSESGLSKSAVLHGASHDWFASWTSPDGCYLHAEWLDETTHQRKPIWYSVPEKILMLPNGAHLRTYITKPNSSSAAVPVPVLVPPTRLCLVENHRPRTPRYAARLRSS